MSFSINPVSDCKQYCFKFILMSFYLMCRYHVCSIVSIRKRGRKNKKLEGRNGGTKEEGGRETQRDRSHYIDVLPQ